MSALDVISHRSLNEDESLLLNYALIGPGFLLRHFLFAPI